MEDKKTSNNDFVNNEDVEVLDFDDDPKSDEKIIEEIEIIEDELPEQKTLEGEKNLDKPKDNPQEKVVKKEVVKEKIIPKDNNETIKQVQTLEKENKTLEENNKKLAKKVEEIEKEKKVDNPPKEKPKRKTKSIIVVTLVFLLLLSFVIVLPFISDYFEAKKNPVNNNPTNNNNKVNEETNKDKEDNTNFKSNIDVENVLTKIKDTKNYKYQNSIDVYINDKKNQPLSIKNNYLYSFNETKYKVEMNKVVADFSYNTTDYYEKLNEEYYSYINDITTKEYSKETIDEDRFNSIYNMFNNTINHLINNNTVSSEKEITVENKTHINITLTTSVDILKNLSVNTPRIQNRMDTSKLSVKEIKAQLYFNENKELYKVELTVEDPNAYQETIDGKIESSVIKHEFSDFNKIKDIELPNI